MGSTKVWPETLKPLKLEAPRPRLINPTALNLSKLAGYDASVCVGPNGPNVNPTKSRMLDPQTLTEPETSLGRL